MARLAHLEPGRACVTHLLSEETMCSFHMSVGGFFPYNSNACPLRTKDKYIVSPFREICREGVVFSFNLVNTVGIFALLCSLRHTFFC